MRRFVGPMKDAMGILIFLYGGSAVPLLDLLDAGILRSVGVACSLPWLENACWYYSLPAVILIFIYILCVLLRDAITRRKTRREAKQVIAQLKSDAEKESSP